MRRSRGSTSSPTRSVDYRHPPKSPIERAHQREIERISELWEGTQTELRKTDKEIKSLEEKVHILFFILIKSERARASARSGEIELNN